MSTWAPTTDRLDVAFTDIAGVAFDPGTVKFQIKSPSGAITTLTYGASAIVKSTTGAYYIDYTFDTPGLWHWHWEGTGAVAVTEAGHTYVEESPAR